MSSPIVWELWAFVDVLTLALSTISVKLETHGSVYGTAIKLQNIAASPHNILLAANYFMI